MWQCLYQRVGGCDFQRCGLETGTRTKCLNSKAPMIMPKDQSCEVRSGLAILQRKTVSPLSAPKAMVFS